MTVMAEEARAQQAQMGMAGGGQIGFDCSRAYAGARDSLDMLKHTWHVEDAEKRLLGDKYPVSQSATEVFLQGGANSNVSEGGSGLRRRGTKSSRRG